MESESFCVFVFTPSSDGAYSRMFAPEYGIPEDPATGSSTGPLAVFMMRRGSISNAAGTRFVSEQGTKMGGRDDIERRLRHGAGLQFWNPDLVQEKLLVTSVKTPLAGRVLARSEMRNRLPER